MTKSITVTLQPSEVRDAILKAVYTADKSLVELKNRVEMTFILSRYETECYVTVNFTEEKPK